MPVRSRLRRPCNHARKAWNVDPHPLVINVMAVMTYELRNPRGADTEHFLHVATEFWPSNQMPGRRAAGDVVVIKVFVPCNRCNSWISDPCDSGLLVSVLWTL